MPLVLWHIYGARVCLQMERLSSKGVKCLCRRFDVSGWHRLTQFYLVLELMLLTRWNGYVSSLYVSLNPVIFKETPEKLQEFSFITSDNLLHEPELLVSLLRPQFLCLLEISKVLFSLKIILFHKLENQSLELWGLTLINKYHKWREKESTFCS